MKQLIKKLEPLLKRNDVIDVIIFGSTAKGKIRPADVDIALLVKEKNPDLKKKVKDLLPQADVQILTFEDYSRSLFFTLLKEGYSIKHKKYIHTMYGTSPVKLYRYSLKSLTASKKVMFERGIKTISGLTRLSNRVVLVPITHSGEFEDFLRQWNLDIETEEYELVPFLRKEEIF